MTIAVWIVSALVAFAFLAAGAMKTFRPKSALRDQMGWVDNFPEWQVKAIGILEILGALGIILPALTGIAPILAPIAAIGLVIIQLGAIVVHARERETPMIVINLVLAALAAFVAIGRLLGF